MITQSTHQNTLTYLTDGHTPQSTLNLPGWWSYPSENTPEHTYLATCEHPLRAHSHQLMDTPLGAHLDEVMPEATAVSDTFQKHISFEASQSKGTEMSQNLGQTVPVFKKVMDSL